MELVVFGPLLHTVTFSLLLGGRCLLSSTAYRDCHFVIWMRLSFVLYCIRRRSSQKVVVFCPLLRTATISLLYPVSSDVCNGYLRLERVYIDNIYP